MFKGDCSIRFSLYTEKNFFGQYILQFGAVCFKIREDSAQTRFVV